MPANRRRHAASDTARPAGSPRRGILLAVALILLVGALTFVNSLSAPFIYDDDAVVAENATIKSPNIFSSLVNTPRGGAPTAGRPLANFSFAVNFAIGGPDARGYHAVNIAVHLCCALLLFGIVRRTLVVDNVAAQTGRAGSLKGLRYEGSHRDAACVAQGFSPADKNSPEGLRYKGSSEQGSSPAGSGELSATTLALVCALIWMVHPLQTEAVDYISARTESLMAFFFLLTLYCSIRSHSAGTPAAWQVAAVAACAAGAMCKESMAVAVPIVMLYDRTFLFSSWRDTMRSRWPLYLALAATWVELAWLVSRAPRGSSAGWSPDPGLVTPVTPAVYLLNQAVMIVRYLRLTFWPTAMVLDYGVPRALTLAHVAPQMMAVSALGVLTLVALIRAPAVGFLGAWFFVTLAPSSSVVPIYTEVGAERRMYLASMAIVVLVVVAVYRWIRRRGGPATNVFYAAAVVVVGALAALTIARNAEYASPLTMWRTVVDRWPNGRARWALATQLQAAGRADEALPLLREAAADYPDAHRGIGDALFARKDYQGAIEELDTFVRMRPAHVNVLDAHELAGRALAAQGKVDEAIARFRLILKMVPGYAAAHGRLADLYFEHQRFAEAAAEYAPFLAARPNEAGPWTNYGISLFQTGRRDEAVKAFERAVMLEPQNAGARHNLAAAREPRP